MRFMHTADWHLGRQLHNVNLLDDQRFVLEQFVALAREAKPDVVLIAGDIYDRAVPPADAVKLLDDVLAELVLDLGTAVVLIAGNHDSPNRLQFGARLMARAQLFVVGTCGAAPVRLAFADAAGPVAVYPLPYLEPLSVREVLGDPEIHDHDDATAALLGRLPRQPGERAILLTHAYVAGGQLSTDSERPLTLGGSGEVACERFADFDYTALGHLHCAQTVSGQIRYAGSLLKYAFSEASQRKGVHVVEMDARGACTVETVPLAPRRDVRCLRGSLLDLLAAAEADDGRDDYLQITLTDRQPLLDIMARLREVYPNVLFAGRDEPALKLVDTPVIDHRTLDPASLFDDFFRLVSGEAMREDERREFIRVVEAMEREEREATAV